MIYFLIASLFVLFTVLLTTGSLPKLTKGFFTFARWVRDLSGFFLGVIVFGAIYLTHKRGETDLTDEWRW